MVERPINVRSKKDKDKANTDETKAIEMPFEVLKGKYTDDKDGNEYNFGCCDEDDDIVFIVSSCMREHSFDRTSTVVDNDRPTGDDDVDNE